MPSPPPPPPPPTAPRLPSLPPPPPAVEVQALDVVVSGNESTAACFASAGCTFSYALALTPLMTAPTSPTSGLNEGETLTVKGHGLSTAAAENVVTVGGQPCDVVSAAVDDTYSAPSCPVTSCTQELQTLITLQCRLPHLDTLAPHAIQLGTRTSAGAFNGYSPALSGATITVTPIVRSFAPSSGSVAGGTLIRFEGDGLSDRLGDLDVTIGGGRCSVTQSNVSSLSCVAPIAADLTSSTNAAVVVRVRGSTAACSVSPCSYTYSRARTPILTGATIVSSPPTSDWTIELAGTFEDDCSDCVVSIGGGTPCALTSTSSTSITCTSAPPLSGTQVITLVSYEWGSGLGDPALPTVEGVELSATSFAPSEVSLAGGTDLVIGGAGFSPTSSKVAVCGKACAVTSVSARTLTCTVPSLLLHASGTHGVNLTNVTTAELDLGYVAPPPPPPGTVDLWSGREGITMQQGKVVAFAFAGLNDTNLPRGRKLSSVTLTVAADRGASGALVVDVRASLECGAADAPPISSADLALSNLAAYDATNATVEWDVQNFVGLDTEESPDLSGLLVDALDARATLEGCSVVVLLAPREGPGWRTFHAPTARDVTKRPFLGFTYVPPTTSDQLAWTSDRSCAVSVSVPTPVPPGGTCTVYDSATQRSVYDSNSCPHVELAATAATTSDSCAMAVNGLDLFSSATGCALDKLVVGRDGVCAALIDPYAPRAACFDTKTQGEGAEQLASWIDALPQGASAMIVSCSRLSWAHNRNDLATALAKLGALNPPTRIDDAYALVGTRGASTPLAEARTACCENPDPVCATCDQTPAFAKADVACGVSAASSASALAAASYVGSWGSAGQLAAVSAVVSGSTAARVGSTASSVFDALAGMQASDVDVYDAECDTALTDGDGSVRFGARLATDGDQSSYWYSAGRPDAVLTLDLGSTQLVKTLKLEWEHPASSVLALYSSSSIGSDWEVGSSIHQASTPPTQLALDGAGDGVLVRRVRLYMADAANATWPVFALRELVAESCVLPEATVTVSSQLAYQRAKTPLVTLVAPRRGSTAGGTRLTISVSGLPASITPSAVTVAIAGTACVVTGVDVQGGRVSCTTGSYGRTSLANPGAGLVQLSVAGLGTAAATAAAHYEYIDLWSRRTTWGGEGYTIPGLETRGDSIWIQNGQRILLDCDISVYMLIVQGALEFDRKDIFMDASYIFVMGGSFTVGTEAEPFLQRAIITLHGSPAAKEIPVYGAKALACRFCTLDLHGKPVLDGRTHTQLAQTAPKGATEIHLMKPVDWDVGSQSILLHAHRAHAPRSLRIRMAPRPALAHPLCTKERGCVCVCSCERCSHSRRHLHGGQRDVRRVRHDWNRRGARRRHPPAAEQGAHVRPLGRDHAL